VWAKEVLDKVGVPEVAYTYPPRPISPKALKGAFYDIHE
jgi:hypothetical protein